MIGKFRIFIKGEFFYYGWVKDRGGIVWISPPAHGDMSQEELKNKSEASTGRPDRKGVEAFADDIVKFSLIEDPETTYTGIIKYHVSSCGWVIESPSIKEFYPSGAVSMALIQHKTVEIIGSIHTSPELLGGKP